ncbi:MAG: XisI protein [Acidobacteria bacterium]|nr:XisI protein [Acidobacteriota bacterium]
MDRITKYRMALQQVIEEYAALLSTGNQAKILPVCDTVHDEYLLITLGWINNRREHAICFHARLLGDQVRLEVDLTEEGLTDALIEAGIAAADIDYHWATRPRETESIAMAA